MVYSILKTTILETKSANERFFLYIWLMEKIGLIKVTLKAVEGLMNIISLLVQYVKLKPNDSERLMRLLDALEGVQDMLHELMKKRV